MAGDPAAQSQHANGSSSLVPALTMAIPALIFSVVALSIVFVGSHELGLSDRQTTTMIIGFYGIPGVLSLAFSYIFRQPLTFAWNINALVFLASLTNSFTLNEMAGATMIAGIAVVLIGVLGISDRLAAVLPMPIVFGLLAGLILPYIVRIFSELGEAPLLIGAPVIAFLLGRLFLIDRVPPVLLAVITGFIVAGFLGEIGSPVGSWSFPDTSGVTPSFSPASVLTMSPVVTILIIVQGNLISTSYLEHQQYHPPRRVIDIATGLCTAAASFFTIGLVGMASFLTPLTSGPDAGEHRLRYWSSYATGGGFVLIALLAGMAAAWSTAAPISLLLTLAGLALLGILMQSMIEITKGPLTLGPLFAFAITLSDLTLLGLGNVFWALVIGTGISILLEGHNPFGAGQRARSEA